MLSIDVHTAGVDIRCHNVDGTITKDGDHMETPHEEGHGVERTNARPSGKESIALPMDCRQEANDQPEHIEGPCRSQGEDAEKKIEGQGDNGSEDIARAYVRRFLEHTFYVDNLKQNRVWWMGNDQSGYKVIDIDFEAADIYVIGVVMNNYLIDVGCGSKYSLHIEISEDTKENLIEFFETCPSTKTDSTSFRLPLYGKTLKLSCKQDDCFTIQELAASSGQLQFPNVFEAKSTSKGLKKGEALPELEAAKLRRFETVIVTFHIRSWDRGTGGISAVLQQVVAIDKDMAPDNLKEDTGSGRILAIPPPSKKRRTIA